MKIYSAVMRETNVIVGIILAAFLLSGLGGIIIGATLSPTAVFVGAGVLALVLIVLIILALWRQRNY